MDCEQPKPCDRETIADELYKEGLTRTRLSRERIRQIEVRALKKCMEWCEKHGFKIEDFS